MYNNSGEGAMSHEAQVAIPHSCHAQGESRKYPTKIPVPALPMSPLLSHTQISTANASIASGAVSIPGISTVVETRMLKPLIAATMLMTAKASPPKIAKLASFEDMSTTRPFGTTCTRQEGPALGQLSNEGNATISRRESALANPLSC